MFFLIINCRYFSKSYQAGEFLLRGDSFYQFREYRVDEETLEFESLGVSVLSIRFLKECEESEFYKVYFFNDLDELHRACLEVVKESLLK